MSQIRSTDRRQQHPRIVRRNPDDEGERTPATDEGEQGSRESPGKRTEDELDLCGRGPMGPQCDESLCNHGDVTAERWYRGVTASNLVLPAAREKRDRERRGAITLEVVSLPGVAPAPGPRKGSGAMKPRHPIRRIEC